MSSAERVEKFLVDARQTISSGSEAKIISEVNRLRQWLQKHQNELLDDSHKQILFSAIEVFYAYNWKSSFSLADAIQSLVGDFLQMPEGKLLASKSKKKALKWMDDFAAAFSNLDKASSGNSTVTRVEKVERWMVAEISGDGKLTLMPTDVNNDGIIEDVQVDDSEQLNKIESLFNEEDYVEVAIIRMGNGNALRIVDIFRQSGESVA